jgi:hypothetical protein
MAWLFAIVVLGILWVIGYIFGGWLLAWVGVEQLVRVAFALSFASAFGKEIGAAIMRRT